MALLSISAEAKIWRVNSQSNYNGSTLFGENFGGTPAYPVFKQINQATNHSRIISLYPDPTSNQRHIDNLSNSNTKKQNRWKIKI